MRYISDGFCTSVKPIREVVCAGNCLPIMDLPWYAEFVKVWARSKLREWQCEEDIVRRKSVHLLCQNGQYRKYRIKVVKSCKCKNSVDQHNRTVPGSGKKKKKRKKGRKGKGSRRQASQERKTEERRRKRKERPQPGENAKETEEQSMGQETVDISEIHQKLKADSEGGKVKTDRNRKSNPSQGQTTREENGDRLEKDKHQTSLSASG